MITNFPNGVSSFGMPMLPGVGMPFTGDVYFVDPVNGNDGNDGKAAAVGRAFKTLYRAHGECTDKHNDVVFLIGNGKLAGSATLTLAGAVAEAARTGAAVPTAGTLLWTKHATHLIGISSGNGIASRARIGSSYGVDGVAYTQATFGSANMINVTGEGCLFQNIHATDDFSTGSAASILWYDKGQRNTYIGCHFNGINTAAAAADAGSRSLKVGYGGNGEHLFVDCIVGSDTVSRGAVANASLELAGATPRNSFVNCIFPIMASSAVPVCIIGSAASCIDRFTIFDRCMFLGAVKSTGTAMTGVALLAASAGGLLVMRDCIMIGDTNTNWGYDATSLAQMYVHGAYAAATTGLGINPT